MSLLFEAGLSPDFDELKKKLRHELGLQFKHLTVEELKLLVPTKEEMSSMKLVTHSGHNITIYSLASNPAFFELNEQVFPTVYTLWKFPELTPVFTTWPPVFNKLCGGADLMLPGLVVEGPVGPNTFSHIIKGKACSVSLVGNRAPIAIGRAALSGKEMYECAMRGKGVHIMHTYKDLLWALGDKQEPPLIDDSQLTRSIQSSESSTEHEGESVASGSGLTTRDDVTDSQPVAVACEGVASMEGEGAGMRTEGPGGAGEEGGETEDKWDDEEGSDLPGEEGGGGGSIEERLGQLGVRENADGAEAGGQRPEGDGTDSTPTAEQGPAISTQDQTDALLTHCFLCALKSSVNRKSDLPLLTSAFYRNHMLKFCPADQAMDVKRSSYKKLGKFLQAMQKQGFIKVKELSKGSDSITEVHKEHPQLREFVVPDLPVQEEPPSTEGGFTPPEITEMYTVTAVALPLFREVTPSISKGDALTVPELRQILQTYVKTNNMQKGSCVVLDPVLSSLATHKGEYLETLRWDELFERVFSKLSPACRFVMPGQPPVLKKGRLEPISMRLATRAGNKKVTLITHLEPYGVDPEQFAHTVQLAVACSTSVTPLPGKGAGSEVLVQGNQVHYAYQLLTEKFKVPKRYIQGSELAPKSGKKKR